MDPPSRIKTAMQRSWSVSLAVPGPSSLSPFGRHSAVGKQMDTLGIEPRASRMLSGCDTTTPCAPLLLEVVAAFKRIWGCEGTQAVTSGSPTKMRQGCRSSELCTPRLVFVMICVRHSKAFSGVWAGFHTIFIVRLGAMWLGRVPKRMSLRQGTPYACMATRIVRGLVV